MLFIWFLVTIPGEILFVAPSIDGVNKANLITAQVLKILCM
jgi:hypothetical protein